MKRITEYRKLLGATTGSTLAELKSIYRQAMKEWHPDKFAGQEEERAAAEEKGKKIISAYHFLVSIAPETKAANEAEYAKTLGSSPVIDFHFKNGMLQIDFADGSSYEYFGVPKDLYVKLVNAPSPPRFIRRHIGTSFLYRKLSASDEE